MNLLACMVIGSWPCSAFCLMVKIISLYAFCVVQPSKVYMEC